MKDNAKKPNFSLIAKALAKRGLRVFPLGDNSKEPVIKGFPTRATADDRQIDTWAKNGPHRNVGVSTTNSAHGPLLVADIDDKDGRTGSETILKLEMEGFVLPPTLTVRTASGGLHYYFTSPFPVKQGVDVFGPGSGVDTRSKGGYVVGPGSIVNGGVYEIVHDLPIAPLPEWFLGRCQRAPEGESKAGEKMDGIDPERARQRALDYLKNRAPHGTAGNRNGTAFRVAAQLKDFGCDPDVILELMEQYWQCSPPAPVEDLEKIIANAFKYSQEPQGSDAPEAIFDDEVSEKAAEEAERKAAGAGSAAGGGDSSGGGADGAGGGAGGGGPNFTAEENCGFGPIPNRDELRLDAWLKRDIPPPDFLSGEVIHTASRILIVGETGIGKTLFNLDWAAAVAAGEDFLNWGGRRRCRVMYLDGEMSDSLFKERLEIVAARYGEDLDLFAYNRDVLGPKEMPPLNTKEGFAWLTRELIAVKPDLIFFDSIMSLTDGNMSEEDSWTAMQTLAQRISGKKIGQVYLHHTGHDATRSYGTKTREWKMTAVVMLTKLDGDESDDITAFNLEFTKARERKPSNRRQFAPSIIRVTPEGFRSEPAAPGNGKKKKVDQHRAWFISTYEQLAAFVEPAAGEIGRKVAVNAIREAMRLHGYLEADEKGITSKGRSDFRRAKEKLLGGTPPLFRQDGEFIYRLREGN
jgi:Bifunctional DNA primase/polymerase, N-terminal/AAA domain